MTSKILVHLLSPSLESSLLNFATIVTGHVPRIDGHSCPLAKVISRSDDDIVAHWNNTHRFNTPRLHHSIHQLHRWLEEELVYLTHGPHYYTHYWDRCSWDTRDGWCAWTHCDIAWFHRWRIYWNQGRGQAEFNRLASLRAFGNILYDLQYVARCLLWVFIRDCFGFLTRLLLYLV